MKILEPESEIEPVRTKRNPVVMVVLGLAISFVVFMWIFAFFFASDVGINRIGDRAWSQRAEATCAAAKTELLGLADFRPIKDVGEGALAERADIVERANTILSDMLDQLAAVLPTDAKGQTVVPAWLADYRTYLADRVAYVADLRAGDGSGFAETEINGSPISNFLGDVARQNEMPSCQVPLDLAV